MGFSAKVPAAALKYFGDAVRDFALHPTVVSEFHPDKGWVRQSYNKRISRSWAAKLARQGVTHVALRSGMRQADFALSELTVR